MRSALLPSVVCVEQQFRFWASLVKSKACKLGRSQSACEYQRDQMAEKPAARQGLSKAVQSAAGDE